MSKKIVRNRPIKWTMRLEDRAPFQGFEYKTTFDKKLITIYKFNPVPQALHGPWPTDPSRYHFRIENGKVLYDSLYDRAYTAGHNPHATQNHAILKAVRLGGGK